MEEAGSMQLNVSERRVMHNTSLPDVVCSLVTQHYVAVYRYAFRLCGSVADAEDLTQQTFLLAVQRIEQLRELEKAQNWLMVIVRNQFLKSRESAVSKTEALMEEPLAETPDDFPDWIDTEQMQIALQKIPDQARTILLMYFFEEISYSSIAEQLQIPIGTVMSRLSRAKAKFKHELIQLQSKTPSH